MIRLRSLLFVPGDRPERMAKAAAGEADVLILDLEDSVVAEAKPEARDAVRDFLTSVRPERSRRAHQSASTSLSLNGDGGPAIFVRINPLDSGLASDDLDGILSARPDGVVLPKAEGAASVRALAEKAPGIPILPIATETAAAVFQLGSYADVGDQLAGLTWGAEDLPAAIGAATSREPDGGYTDPYKIVRALTLFGAHAAGVPAIETVFPDFRDLDGLAAYAARGRRDGFTGMMAIHPAQVPVINAAFTPSDDEIAHARRVIELFAANPGAGALALDGRMIDAPHLKAAQRLLALAGQS